MLTPAEVHQQHVDRVKYAREAFSKVLGENPERKTIVGKYEAHNYVHLKAVLEEADELCPKAADTIRWFLWWAVLDAQRMSFLTEHFKNEPQTQTETSE